MNNEVKLVCQSLFFLLIAFSLIYELESCLTPHKQPGDCVDIHNCAPLIEILKRKPLSTSDVAFLRAAQCEPLSNVPKVCCPVEGDSSIPNRFGDEEDLLPNKDACGTGIEDKIFGGTEADIDEHPWLALIKYEKSNNQTGFHCGGVLINDRNVLTAAHCIANVPETWKIVGVRLGEYNLNNDTDCIHFQSGYKDCTDAPQDIEIERAIQHYGYSKTDTSRAHDIALLRLKKKVKYTDFIKPICLPKTEDEKAKTYGNEKMFISGWGRTENGSQSNIKLKLQLPVISNSDCANTYKSRRITISDRQLCAGGRSGSSACSGDSGGPLMSININSRGDINWFAIGIVSAGPSLCGTDGVPGIFTRISSYMGWIKSELY